MDGAGVDARRIVRTFYVYELDDEKAAALAKTAIQATNGERIDTVKLLDVDELEKHGLKSGDVKQFVTGLV